MRDEQAKNIRPYLQYIILGILLLFSWLLQSAPGNFLVIVGVRPVLLVVFTACVGILYGEMTGGVFGLVAGMLMDLYTVPSLAFNVVILSVIGIVCGLAVKHLLMNHFLSAMVLCFAVSLLYFFLYWLLFKGISGGGGWVYFYRFSLPGAVYTALTGFLYCPLVAFIRQRL